MPKRIIEIDKHSNDEVLNTSIRDKKKTFAGVSIYAEGLIEIEAWNGEKLIKIAVESIGKKDMSVSIAYDKPNDSQEVIEIFNIDKKNQGILVGDIIISKLTEKERQ